MEGGFNPLTLEAVFQDFKGRRTGLIKALTTDVEEFFQQCDPEKGNLCLYGYPTGKWEVNLPVEEVPSDLPEPVLGINSARDGMQEKDWLSLIAIHCDSWLLAVSFNFGARIRFDEADRKRLFDMINELPTVFEVVTKQWREKSTVSSYSSDEHMPNSNVAFSELQPKVTDEGLDEEGDEEEEEEEEDGDTLCGACGKYASDEFWIFCEFCERWFHGKCVNITPEIAKHIEQYKCRSCSKKKARA